MLDTTLIGLNEIMLDIPIAMFDLVLLLIASFFGSLLSATMGVGGGSFLLVVMASLLPPAALIPLHGIVQLGSNATRSAHTRAHIHWPTVIPFLVGAIFVTFVGLISYRAIDTDWIPLLVALFILWLNWGYMPKLNLSESKVGMAMGGVITTYTSLFVGATGPLVAAWIGTNNENRWQYTANFSTCMTLQHSLKLIVFGFLGFTFIDWLFIAVLMIMAGYVGTRIGLYLLDKIDQTVFGLMFKIVLSALALRIIWQYFAHHFL